MESAKPWAVSPPPAGHSRRGIAERAGRSGREGSSEAAGRGKPVCSPARGRTALAAEAPTAQEAGGQLGRTFQSGPSRESQARPFGFPGPLWSAPPRTLRIPSLSKHSRGRDSPQAGTLKAEGHSGPSEQIPGGSDGGRASWRPCPSILEGRPRADPAGHPPEAGGGESRAPRSFYLAILHRPPGRAGDREGGGGDARCAGTGCRCGAPEPAGAPRGPRAEPASGRRGLRAGGAG